MVATLILKILKSHHRKSGWKKLLFPLPSFLSMLWNQETFPSTCEDQPVWNEIKWAVWENQSFYIPFGQGRNSGGCSEGFSRWSPVLGFSQWSLVLDAQGQGPHCSCWSSVLPSLCRHLQSMWMGTIWIQGEKAVLGCWVDFPLRSGQQHMAPRCNMILGKNSQEPSWRQYSSVGKGPGIRARRCRF